MTTRRCVFACLAATALSFLLPVSAHAEVTLPALFSDHMVLQRDKPVAVWGWADQGEKVEVSLAGTTVRTTADADGRWRVEVGPLSAGGPHKLSVSGENTLTIKDVLVGEVWLCSGQSNMAFAVKNAANAEAEIAAADYPQIRMFHVAVDPQDEPQSDCEGDWQVCSPETVGAYSATAYFFGRKLHKELGVPVGLIKSARGGTAVEAWTDLTLQRDLAELAPILEPWDKQVAAYDAAEAQAKYEAALAKWEAAKKAAAKGDKVPKKPVLAPNPRVNQNHPGTLYNGMICPLVPYGIRGAIWYQGERNSKDERSTLYGLQLRLLIDNWRRDFGQGDFPFLFVQLPNFRAAQSEPSENSAWVHVREQMLKTLAHKNTGMAIAIDVGEANDIHPKNKQAVGRRLALWALAKTYGQANIASGPIYSGVKRRDGAMVIEFDYTGDGLKTTDGKPPVGFALAGKDRKFVWADAKIEGDTVVVSSPQVPDPVAVRYAWMNNPTVNLVNSADLPASPFRTDHWREPILGR